MSCLPAFHILPLSASISGIIIVSNILLQRLFPLGIIFFSLRALYPSRPEPGGLIIEIFFLVRRRKQRRRKRRRRRRPQLPIHQVWRGSDGRGGDPGGHLHFQVDGAKGPGMVAGGGCCQRWLSCGVAWRLAALSIYISPPPPF